MAIEIADLESVMCIKLLLQSSILKQYFKVLFVEYCVCLTYPEFRCRRMLLYVIILVLV